MKFTADPCSRQGKSFDPDLIPQYRQGFLASHYPPFALQSIAAQQKRTWFTYREKSEYLHDGHLKSHLQGKYWVAQNPRIFSRCLVVDIDNGPGLEDRTQKAMTAFPDAAPLVFTTPRGGLHLYYMLPPGWSKRVHQFAVNRLTHAGVDLAPGKIEVYPNGGRAIRLPLGRDCQFLDHQTLEPVHPSRSRQLEALHTTLRDHRYDTLVIPGSEDVPAQKRQSKPYHLRPRNGDPSQVGEFMLEVDRLLTFGLKEKGERNTSTLKLCWYFHAVQGMNGPQVEDALWQWITTKHNGQSEDFAQNPQRVRKLIGDAVKHFDPAKVGTGSQVAPERPRNGDNELRDRIAAFVAGLPLDDRGKRLLSRGLEYAHKRGIQKGGGIEVQIPSRTLKSFDWQYGHILPTLLEHGYISKTMGYSEKLGICNTYFFRCPST